MAVFAIASAVLAWQEYYGRSAFYQDNIYPSLYNLDQSFPAWIQLAKYNVWYRYLWWELSLMLGYVVFPFTIWKILFPKDSLLDFGLRTHGFFQHIRIYGLFLLLITLAVVFARFSVKFYSLLPLLRICLTQLVRSHTLRGYILA